MVLALHCRVDNVPRNKEIGGVDNITNTIFFFYLKKFFVLYFIFLQRRRNLYVKYLYYRHILLYIGRFMYVNICHTLNTLYIF